MKYEPKDPGWQCRLVATDDKEQLAKHLRKVWKLSAKETKAFLAGEPFAVAPSDEIDRYYLSNELRRIGTRVVWEKKEPPP